MAAACLAFLVMAAAPDPAFASQNPEEDIEEAERPGWNDREMDRPGRRALEGMSRRELEEAGFVFEDTLTQRSRAHATVFALTAGAVVQGAGHWQLEDTRTALFLLTMEVAALSLIGGGVALALNPTGYSAIDQRRRDLWQLGVGMLGMSWLIDIFGTAYRDDLGIPTSTQRNFGWGFGLNYEYWRPRDLSLRHVSTARMEAKTKHFHLHGESSQELGYGMSNYKLGGRWFPLVGSTNETHLGVQLTGQFLQYRLDEPFERLDADARLLLSLNLGRLFAHLDQMSAGVEVGMGFRGYRFLDELDEWNPFGFAGWYVPLRMFLALNLTDQLRLETSFERWDGGWLERRPGRIGVPMVQFSYRSTDNLDLSFFTAFGDGVGLGAGLRLWFGE